MGPTRDDTPVFSRRQLAHECRWAFFAGAVFGVWLLWVVPAVLEVIRR